MLLIDWLLKEFPTAKRQNLKRMVSDRRVLINEVPARALKQPIGESDRVRVAPRPVKVKAGLEPLRLLHEDGDVLVVEKPAGLLTSTVANEKRPTAIAILRSYLEDHDARARVGVIHRLDREASGLLVFSKNQEAFDSLKSQFAHHTVKRVYTALVEGTPQEPAGTVRSFLVELPSGKVRTSRRPDAGLEAITEYDSIGQVEGMTLLRVTLQTGRKHQIRAHVSEMGHPIVGDLMYGAQPAARVMLSATELEFDHPSTGQRMKFVIKPPEELTELMGGKPKHAAPKSRKQFGHPGSIPARHKNRK
jgi:23S rRNA pseudouridine1911/1915/1917 synthase